MSSVLQKIYSSQWAITENGLYTLLSIAKRLGSADALALARELKAPAQAMRDHLLTRKENGLYYRGDTAVISINGPIIPYADMFSEMSGCSSIETIKKQFAAALADPSIKRIIFDIDSPGGNVTEVYSLALLIFQARGSKNIEAYIGGSGCSAAYWIASATSKIYIDKTSEAGSIGVVYSFTDTTVKDEREGVKRRNITNIDSPKKRIDPASEEFEKELTILATDIAEVFFEDVAKNRNVSVEAAKKNFGEGGVFVGRKAVKAGLCDCLSTFEEMLKQQPKTNQENKPKMTDEEIKDLQAKNKQQATTIGTQAEQIKDLTKEVNNLKAGLEKTAADNRLEKFNSLVDKKVKEGTAKGHSEESIEMKCFKATFAGKFEKFSALDDETIASTINATNFSQAKVEINEPGFHGSSGKAIVVDCTNC